VAEDDAVSDITFYRIRAVTDSRLDISALKAIYEAARSVSRGVYVEIGPAQGGSTVAIALGRRTAGRSEAIYTADVFKGSAALKTKDVDLNIEVLKWHLRRFGLEQGVKVVPIGRSDLATAVPAEIEIGLLFVDADGAIDRDLALFYDLLAPGALIILDDCENKISDKYVLFAEGRLARYVASKGVDDIAALTPLGKHYTVFRFTRRLIALGLVEELRTVVNTVFLRKVGDQTYAESGAPAAMMEEREAIAAEFAARRASRESGRAGVFPPTGPVDELYLPSRSESVFSARELKNTAVILGIVCDYFHGLSRGKVPIRLLRLDVDESPEALALLKAEVDAQKPDGVQFEHAHLSTEATVDLGDWLSGRGYELLYDQHTVLGLNSASFDAGLIRLCQNILYAAHVV
jgi:predicted O-methyltransferase YrrM